MTNIYDKHDAAFNLVSAYVILRGNTPIGKIALKFPKDGMGRLTCFLHLYKSPMINAHVSGCGYDKRTAVISKAVANLDSNSLDYIHVKNDIIKLQEMFAACKGHDFDSIFYNNTEYSLFRAV